MTTGALIFATNNGVTDYDSMARWSAKNIERHLGIPTHIVSGTVTTTDATRHFVDLGQVAWHNRTRPDAYDLSPWDRTLLLDADYVVASDQLRSLLDVDQDFLAHRWATDVTGCNDFRGLNWFGEHQIPMWWATVIMFRRSVHARLIFDAMCMIRDNWTHYRQIYKISQKTFRNDYALSIAMLICDGHDPNHAEIPWSLTTLTPEHRIRQTAIDQFRVDFVNGENQHRWMDFSQDIHVMGKSQLEAIIADNC